LVILSLEQLAYLLARGERRGDEAAPAVDIGLPGDEL